MKKKLVYSSETYLIRTHDIGSLPLNAHHKSGKEVIVLLDERTGQETLYAGLVPLRRALKEQQKYIPVRFAYYSFPLAMGFFINLIKPIKKRFYHAFQGIYRIPLSEIVDKKLARGIRTQENAYQWTNKRWRISQNSAQKRYKSLYRSLKNGYDRNQPMLILLNRHGGVQDQLLQGHHRLGICQELGISEVSVSFWTAPVSPAFLKPFFKTKSTQEKQPIEVSSSLKKALNHK